MAFGRGKMKVKQNMDFRFSQLSGWLDWNVLRPVDNIRL